MMPMAYRSLPGIGWLAQELFLGRRHMLGCGADAMVGWMGLRKLLGQDLWQRQSQ